MPLVSILIITYNSSGFVLETLESAKTQTYENIELIVSDDASTDNTVEICEQWCKANEGRFVRTRIVATDKNTGVAGNVNRGLFECNGVWIKYIAGDDIMLPDSINQNVSFTKTNADIQCVLSKYKLLTKANDTWDAIDAKGDFSNYLLFHPKVSAQDQLLLMVHNQRYRIITSFIKADVFSSIGGFDEDYPMYEDEPLLYRILGKGYKLFFLNEYTVSYRIHDKSISLENNELIYSDWLLKYFLPGQQKYRVPHLSYIQKLVWAYNLNIAKLFSSTILNKRTLVNRTINYVLTKPSLYLEKTINKRYGNRVARNYQIADFYIK